MKFLPIFLLASITAIAAPKSPLHSLPKEDGFRKTVASIATEWNDGNITTGTSDAYAGQVRVMPHGDREWEELSKDIFHETFKDTTGERVPANPALKTKVSDFSNSLAEKCVRALAEANAHDMSNAENLEPYRNRLWVLLRKLSGTKKGEKIVDMKVLVSGARYMNESTESKRWVRSTTFVNTETGVALVVFTIEGTM